MERWSRPPFSENQVAGLQLGSFADTILVSSTLVGYNLEGTDIACAIRAKEGCPTRALSGSRRPDVVSGRLLCIATSNVRLRALIGDTVLLG